MPFRIYFLARVTARIAIDIHEEARITFANIPDRQRFTLGAPGQVHRISVTERGRDMDVDIDEGSIGYRVGVCDLDVVAIAKPKGRQCGRRQRALFL